jgi:hypothetical protein
MTRIAAPELEDYSWFPVPMRDAITGFLRVAAETLGVQRLAVPMVLEALSTLDGAGATRIVDLCSGGGGPVLELVRGLEQHHGKRVDALLTDKFPNHRAFERAEHELPGRVTGRRESMDATQVPAELLGVRTIFNAFHHLPPPLARAVLADAAQQQQPILTFDFVERSVLGFGTAATTPLSFPLLLPFVRPVSALALALTYAVPLLPAVTLWDGLASCLRAHSPQELEAMVDGLARPDYQFRVVRQRIPGRPHYVTSVIGMPV